MNTIVRIHNNGAYRYEEFTAGEAGIYPGMLLEINSSGNAIKHNSASTVAEKMFAMEDALQGDDVTDVYTSGTKVCVLIGQSGTVVNALCNSGTNYTKGTIVESHGDGTLASGSTYPIGVVEVATDLSDSGAVDTLVPVRLL